MRNTLLLVIITFLVYSCSLNSEKNVKLKALEAAEKYAAAQLRNPERKVLRDSTIMYRDTVRRYFILPSRVCTGLIDADDKTDAIVSVTSDSKYGQVLNEHLIILNSDGRYLVVRSVESDMKVVSVKNGIITALLPKKPVNNPLHNCPVCTETVQYRFRNGELEKVE